MVVGKEGRGKGGVMVKEEEEEEERMAVGGGVVRGRVVGVEDAAKDGREGSAVKEEEEEEVLKGGSYVLDEGEERVKVEDVEEG